MNKNKKNKRYKSNPEISDLVELLRQLVYIGDNYYASLSRASELYTHSEREQREQIHNKIASAEYLIWQVEKKFSLAEFHATRRFPTTLHV